MRSKTGPTPADLLSSETGLRAIVAALLDDCASMSPEETIHLPRKTSSVPAKTLAGIREHIREGNDPLGDAYARIFSPATRRASGITLTPPAIVARMMDVASELASTPMRIVDCGAGSGRFSLEALRRHPRAHVVACEASPLLAQISRASAHAAGLGKRLELRIGDFRDLQLPSVRGTTLFIGNPPYVRHHDIEPRWKSWYQDGLKKDGLPGSQLAGLHLHFFLKARQLARLGDAGCFITSAEWLDVNYGQSLRELLLGPLGGRSIHLFPAETSLFKDALTTSAITTFKPGGALPGIGFTEVAPSNRSITHWVPAPELHRSKTWSGFARPCIPCADGATAKLGDYFRISRGQVTGLNRVWTDAIAAKCLPSSCLFPAVTHAREIIDLNGQPLINATALSRVIDLPADLASLTPGDRKNVEHFLTWAEKEGARDSYVAQHREHWWRVNLKAPPPIIMTYMGRRPPVFARNLAGVRLLNIAHGLYPRLPLDNAIMDALVAWLNHNVSSSRGRTYAGGLVKFEPGEAMRIPVPPLDYFRHVA